MTDEKVQTLEDQVNVIKPNTKAAEAHLSIGYGGMTVKDAELIIKERKADPHSHPYERYKEAEAFLAAYKSKSQVISTRPGWKRKRNTR